MESHTHQPWALLLVWQEEAVLATITSLLFALLVWWACALQGSLLVFLLAYYLTTMLAICLTYVIATLMPNPEASSALTATYITTCMYFGGLFLLFEKMPDYIYCVCTSLPSATRTCCCPGCPS